MRFCYSFRYYENSNEFSELWSELIKIIRKINKIFKDEQEIEFSITRKSIHILQSRNVILTEKEKSVKVDGVNVGQGLGSASGIVKGNVSFDGLSDSIFCLKELNPQDIDNLLECRGVLSKSGDHNCHLAVLCRLLKKPYIVGAELSEPLKDGESLILNTFLGTILKEAK